MQCKSTCGNYEVLAGVVSRMMFHRVTKQRAEDEVVSMTYISSLKMFEFGPLPAGQPAEMYAVYCYATLCFVAFII